MTAQGYRVVVPALLILVGAVPAAAHRVNVFAAVEGDDLVGYAYAAGGERVRHATVEVLGPDDRLLGAVRTDASGEFRFTPRARADHRLVVDTGDGHRAEWTVRAEELPASLPVLAEAAPPAEDVPAQALETEPPPDALEALVARAVAGEVAPLRAEIQRYRAELDAREGKARLHDVIGGIGYLVGLAGLAFYFLGLRRHTPPAPPRDRTP